jgi:hypothetical protein
MTAIRTNRRASIQKFGVWTFLFDLLFGDLNHRRARGHCHTTIRRVPDPMRAYRAAPHEVRLTARMLLHEQSERQASGNIAPASSAMITALISASALVGAVVMALFNGSLSMAGAGTASSNLQEVVTSTFSSVAWIIVIVITSGVVVVVAARRRDQARATATAWLAEYRSAEGAIQGGGDAIPAIDQNELSGFCDPRHCPTETPTP